jgi:hypothetical protein
MASTESPRARTRNTSEHQSRMPLGPQLAAHNLLLSLPKWSVSPPNFSWRLADPKPHLTLVTIHEVSVSNSERDALQLVCVKLPGLIGMERVRASCRRPM